MALLGCFHGAPDFGQHHYALTPRFLGLIKDYMARYKHVGTVDPEFPIFYEKEEDEEVKARAE